MKLSCVDHMSTTPLSLVDRCREAGRVFDIRASYISYYFVVVKLNQGNRFGRKEGSGNIIISFAR